MSTDLIVEGNVYTFPDQGAVPPWGADVAAWAAAVTETLAGINSIGDILARSATIGNNTSSVADVNGLIFDGVSVRGARILYSIYRTSSAIVTPKVEGGVLDIEFDGTNWTISRESSADTGIVFTITNNGQVQYTSSSIPGTSYSGKMSYRAFANGVV